MKAHQRQARQKAAGPVLPRWFFGEGALEEAAGELGKLAQPLLLVGEAKLISPLRKRLISALIQDGVELKIEEFPEGSECTRGLAEALASKAKAKGAGSLMGLGGGKCLDTVKWAGQLLGLKVASLPTSAATCACATQVVVEHDAQGAVLEVHDLDAAPEICVADFEILGSAPRRLLNAGLADTRAKWLEWAAIEAPEGPGAEAAKKAFEIAGREDAPLHELWDACLRLSAQASNEGGAPAAAAHSFCAGISLLPKSRDWLHGEWVAIGLDFQSLLQAELSKSPKKSSLAKLPFGLDAPELEKVSARILAGGESIHLMDPEGRLTPRMVQNQIQALLP